MYLNHRFFEHIQIENCNLHLVKEAQILNAETGKRHVAVTE